MIHMGSLVGAGISQFESKTFGIKLPFFSRFRNSEDRHNFISAGAAAGIASAFCAPVGGLLFAFEEVSSYWSVNLGKPFSVAWYHPSQLPCSDHASRYLNTTVTLVPFEGSPLPSTMWNTTKE